MFLQKIKLKGFKSFYNKTDIFFNLNKNENTSREAKVTAIVGPNGAGKSNIADALKWGLGVKSKKVFRTKKGSDVIFCGSESKKPLSQASVDLYFKNKDKKIPIEYEDVVITRKIYKDGENYYYVNDTLVPLKEIIQLISRSGLGKENYSIVDQGMADKLISSTPTERKDLIEEAAKVKHLELKKDDSIKKLTKSLFKLEKVDSIIKEIKPRIKFLKKEAEIKSQQKLLEEEMIEKAKKYYSLIISEISDKKSVLQKKINELNTEKEQITIKKEAIKNELQNISNKETKQKKEKVEINSLNQEIRRINQKEFQAQKNIHILDGNIELSKQRIKHEREMNQQKVDLGFVKEKITKLIHLIQEHIDKNHFNEKSLIDIKEYSQKINMDIEQGVVKKDIDRKINQLEKEIELLRKKIKDQRIDLESIKKRKNQLIVSISNINNEERKNKESFFELQKKIDTLDLKKEEVVDKINQIEVEIAKLEVREEESRNNFYNLTKKHFKAIDRQKISETRDELKTSIENNKLKLYQAQSIDDSVIKEHKEAQERYDFLNSEFIDIQSSIQNLKEIIKRLDVKINYRFEKTFNQINQKFTKYFNILFKGGSAQLIKQSATLDSKSAQNDNNGSSLSGIDINLIIPRKKIKNLTMLSGGEKTLTSLALLFAMIETSSPPFVLLDEVDAALDEVNSNHFAKILKEVSKNTQIIIITHNREVMSQAEILYGVTMQKDGISNVVSVKLGDN